MRGKKILNMHITLTKLEVNSRELSSYVSINIESHPLLMPLRIGIRYRLKPLKIKSERLSVKR
jgi:hypothetical protein